MTKPSPDPSEMAREWLDTVDFVHDDDVADQLETLLSRVQAEGEAEGLEKACKAICPFCEGQNLALPYEQHGAVAWFHHTTDGEKISCQAAAIRALSAPAQPEEKKG